MNYKKSHNGKSALQILDGAAVSETKGGGFEVFTKSGHAVMRADNGDLLLRDQYSFVDEEWICIECAPRAYEKLDGLNDEKNAAFAVQREA